MTVVMTVLRFLHVCCEIARLRLSTADDRAPIMEPRAFASPPEPTTARSPGTSETGSDRKTARVMMVTRITRIAALPAVALVLSAAVACTGPDSTPAPAPTGTVSSPATPAPDSSDPVTSPATPVREQGYAMSCSGVRGDGNRVVVELYTNSTVVVPASVVVVKAGEDGDPILLTSDAAQAPTIKDQAVSADVPLVDAATRAAAGTAEVRGTFQPTGNVRQVDDDFTDAGERIRTKGTNEALTTDVRVQIGQERVNLQCSEAFQFDLQVTKTPIG